ncbi:MAG: hypothetical protein DWQ35_15730 [Planctomycetota bacterium]|nr:MAG: hypothetical protein DWQ35_15730 [Planctomycetota bacterium]REK23891.1 MAG: hypothetical protein DWQ42_14215 [Planctomycetota bacterium]
MPQLVIREPQEDPVPELDSMRPNWQPELLGGVVVIEGHATTVAEDAEGNPSTTDAVPFTAIPYYAWNHRGNGQMRVWIPTDPAVIEEELAEARRQREAAKKAKDT